MMRNETPEQEKQMSIGNRIQLVGPIAILMLLITSNCTDMGNQPLVGPPFDWPPTTPVAISPPDRATQVEPDFTLIWSSHDPDGGPVYFDLYLGTDSISIHNGLWFSSNSCASPWGQQENARQLLNQIYQIQTAYYSQYHSYCLNGVTTFAGDSSYYENLGIVPPLNDRYSYFMTAGADLFTCTATANIDFDPDVDTWVIDQSQTLACVIDDIDGPELYTYFYWQVVARDDEGNITTGPVWRFRTRPGYFNYYPEIPRLVSPADESVGNIEVAMFQWECSDPDGDPLVYDFYLDVDPNLGLPRHRNLTRTIWLPPQALRAKAMGVLQEVYFLENSYHDVYNTHWMDGAAACYGIDGLYIMGIIVDSLDVYCYSLDATDSTFVCTASGNLDDDITYDVWSIDQDSELVCISDDLVPPPFEPNNTTYYWRVAAHDDHGHTTMSPIWRFIAEGDSSGF
jgi:hypothetical protein